MMRALRFHGQRDIRLDEIEIPQCGKGQVKLKPAFVGICGTDLNEYIHGANIMPTTPHPITKEKVPLTMGHEISGTVEEVGEGVDDIRVGSRIVVDPLIYDGTCFACKQGYINCCENNGHVGLSGWGGGLSEFMVLPRNFVYEIPDSMSMEAAAIIEPLSVAWHAVKTSPFEKGDSALVLGGGPIGLAVVQVLAAKGAKDIVVSEVAARRREFAKSLGAKYVLNPVQEDVVGKVREICDGVGANVAFDTAGVQAGLDQAVQAIRTRGTLVNIAVWEKAATIMPNSLVFTEKRYMGVATHQRGDFQEVIDAVGTGSLRPESMITAKIKMEEIEEKGFKALETDKDNHVKILIDVGV